MKPFSKNVQPGRSYLIIFGFAWSFVVVIGHLKALVGLNPFPMLGTLIISIWLTGFFGGVLVSSNSGKPILAPAQRSLLPPSGAFMDLLIFGMFVFAFIGHFVWNRYAADTSGMSLAEVRSNRLATMETSRPTAVNYLFYLADLSLYLGVIGCVALKLKRLTRVGCGLVFMVIAVVIFRKTGSRFPFISIFSLIAASYLIFHAELIFRKLRSHVAAAVLLVILMFSVNSILNIIRFEGGAQGREAGLYEVKGGFILEKFGVIDTISPLNAAFGLLDEYTGNVVNYFESYVTENNLDPQNGRFLFRFIFQRFGAFDWFEIKAASDDVLYAIGITYNVWCTGLREIWVDFGWATLATGPLLGIAVTRAYRKRHVSSGSGVLAALLCAWLLFSPFTSIHKNIGFELGLYAGLVIMVVERICGRSLLDFTSGGTFLNYTDQPRFKSVYSKTK